MPTFETTRTFEKDLSLLSEQDRERFHDAVKDFVVDLQSGMPPRFRPALRVHRVRSTPGIWEMTWAPDGRATWQYGPEVIPGEPHIVWRRVGTHDVLNAG